MELKEKHVRRKKLFVITLLSGLLVAVLCLLGCQSANMNGQNPNSDKTSTSTNGSTPSMNGSVPSTNNLKPDVESLGSEKIDLIKSAYVQERLNEGYPPAMIIDDVSIYKYYGNFNDCIVVMLTDRYTGYLGEADVETIAGVAIAYGDANRIIAYKEGILYTLQEAYDAGYLTVANIELIKDIHHTSA